MSSHVSRIGACSPHKISSQQKHTMLWLTLLNRQKLWGQDVKAVIAARHLQDRINKHYQQLHGHAGSAPGARLPCAQKESLRLRAYQNVVSQYHDRLRRFYADNL